MSFCSHWYCSLDVSQPRNIVISGDNMGNVDAVCPKGNKVCYRISVLESSDTKSYEYGDFVKHKTSWPSYQRNQ